MFCLLYLGFSFALWTMCQIFNVSKSEIISLALRVCLRSDWYATTFVHPNSLLIKMCGFIMTLVEVVCGSSCTFVYTLADAYGA